MMRTPLALVLLLLFAAPAFAQRVVILEFEADRGNKLRTQVEKALKKAGTVDLVPIKRWKDLAAKKKLRGGQAMTPSAVGRLSRTAEVDAAVEGAIGAKFFVRILDSTGGELWSKELPLKRGLLSADHARKLARAITAAAKTAPVSTREDEAPAEVQPEPKSEPVARAEPQPDEIDPDQPTRPGELSASEREKRRREEEAEASSATDMREPISPAERDQDLDREGTSPRIKLFKIVRVWLAGTTTWRSYCSRPGVLSCAEYETREPKPSGDTVDFSPQVPYAGFMLNAELFPLGIFSDSPYLAGVMLQGSFALGFSLTKVRVTSPSGETPEKDVVSTDRGWSAMVGYRFPFFFVGHDSPLNQDFGPIGGYIGPRLGVASRVFEIDAKAQVPLPGSFRIFPQLGVDAAVGFRYVRLELGFLYFINPKPGPDEIVGYGNLEDPTGGGRGSGFSFEGGFGGEVWGPIGYTIRFRYTRFSDQFFGQGKKWIKCDDTQCGGAAEESYSGLFWGITASF